MCLFCLLVILTTNCFTCLIYGSESVWESNPPGAFFKPPTDFEDQGPCQGCKHSRRPEFPRQPLKLQGFVILPRLPRFVYLCLPESPFAHPKAPVRTPRRQAPRCRSHAKLGARIRAHLRAGSFPTDPAMAQREVGHLRVRFSCNSLAGSISSTVAVALICGLASECHRNVCVSRRSFTPYTPSCPPAGRQNPGPYR